VSPGSALPGFPPGLVGGATHSNNAVAIQTQVDVTTAGNAIMAVPSFNVGSADLDGLTFLAGSYSSASSLLNSGTMTLQGDADDVFIFTAVSTLTTGSGSTILFTGGAQECKAFWRVGSSATLGTGSRFAGTNAPQASPSGPTGPVLPIPAAPPGAAPVALAPSGLPVLPLAAGGIALLIVGVLGAGVRLANDRRLSRASSPR